MKYLKKHTLLFFILSISVSTILFTCSDENEVEKELEEEMENPDPDPDPEDDIDPNRLITINTGSIVGELYNFWSTRPMVNQTRFNSPNFRAAIEPIKDYVQSYNLVRTMGGRKDNLNTFYQGVDASGNIITNFGGLLTSMRNFLSTGFKPRIVLSKVPWAMVENAVVNDFGNTAPPDDYNLWRAYVNAFLTTLVNEFGLNEVRTWRFRISTEPNYTPNHWDGTMQEYFRHYDITVDEVLKVIPDAIVGPGNMLTENKVATFTTEFIDHCATGTNFATGEIGSKMDFFSISYYEKFDQERINLPELAAPYRAKLDSYSQFANIPFDIQEFGVLRDENGVRGVSLSDGSEMGASWYARVADLAFDFRINEIYDWGQEIENSNLPAARKNVMRMFQMMEGGSRLQAQDIINPNVHAGAIPVLKNGNIYLLVYNHNVTRNSTFRRTYFTRLEGGEISGNSSWKMNEWTVDKDNGTFLHELYKDVRAAGVGEKPNGRIYGNRPSDRFETGWVDVLNANFAKYEAIAELPQTITDSTVTKENEKLTLEVKLEPHSVKLIELIPQ
jgi:xylan 1,4-beta-xylosidase